MKKLSQINEGIFTNGIHRKNQGLEKKEDSLEVKLQEFCDRHADENWYNRKIEDFTITKEGLVDCSSAVLIFDDDLVDGKFPFKFGVVDGFFDCATCDNLTSLEGCPSKTKGAFYVYDSPKLESLEGCSSEVGGDFHFYCCSNITSLDGCPKVVSGDFYCYDNGEDFTEEEILSRCNVKGNIILSE